ncbi:MAG: AMP-binding protein, partial [Bacteroidota bacterium]
MKYKHRSGDQLNSVAYWNNRLDRVQWSSSPVQAPPSNPDADNWFQGGTINLTQGCLDKQVKLGHGNKTAYIFNTPVLGMEVRITYEDLKNQVELTAGMLQKLGFTTGSKVGVLMPNGPAIIYSILGAIRLGCHVCLLETELDQKELARRIDVFQPDVIMVQRVSYNYNSISQHSALLDNALEISQHQPEHIICKGGNNRSDDVRKWFEYDFDELLGFAHPVDLVPVKSEAVVLSSFSNGIDGESALCNFTNGEIAMVSMNSYSEILSENECLWHPESISFDHGCFYGVFGPLMHGHAVLLSEAADFSTQGVHDFWDLVEKTKIT